jgi:hypothetical protein
MPIDLPLIFMIWRPNSSWKMRDMSSSETEMSTIGQSPNELTRNSTQYVPSRRIPKYFRTPMALYCPHGPFEPSQAGPNG